jgi:ribosomal protein S3AE
MAKVVVKSKVKKAKRKFPVEFKAPEYLNSVSLGSSNVTDLNGLIGKTIKMNLMYLTGNVKNQNVRLEFVVTEVTSGVAKTIVKKYSQVSYFLRRFVKANSDLVEDSVVFTTKDGKLVRVKPFMVTKSKTTALVQTSLRQEFRKQMAEELAQMTYDEVMNAVLGGRFNVLFKNNLKKILPLKAFEFKSVELESKR